MLKLKTGKTVYKQNTNERERISIVITLSEMGEDELKHFRDYCAYCADHNADASAILALPFIDTVIRIKNASAENGNGSRAKQTGAGDPRSRGSDSSGR